MTGADSVPVLRRLGAPLPPPRTALRRGAGGVLIVGILDQTTSAFAPSNEPIAQEWRRDDRFFDRLDARLREGAMVVQLPYESFPEPPNAFDGGYEPGEGVPSLVRSPLELRPNARAR